MAIEELLANIPHILFYFSRNYEQPFLLYIQYSYCIVNSHISIYFLFPTTSFSIKLHLYQKLSTIFPLIPLATRKEDLLHIYTDILYTFRVFLRCIYLLTAQLNFNLCNDFIHNLKSEFHSTFFFTSLL